MFLHTLSTAPGSSGQSGNADRGISGSPSAWMHKSLLTPHPLLQQHQHAYQTKPYQSRRALTLSRIDRPRGNVSKGDGCSGLRASFTEPRHDDSARSRES